MSRVGKIKDIPQWAVIRPLAGGLMIGQQAGETHVLGGDNLMVLVAHPQLGGFYRALTIPTLINVGLGPDVFVRIVEPGDITSTGHEIVVDDDVVNNIRVAYIDSTLDIRTVDERNAGLDMIEVLEWALPRPKYRTYIYNLMAEAGDIDTTKDGWQYRIDRTYSPNEIFDLLLRYEGIIGYTEKLKGWVQDIYKVSLGGQDIG